MTAKSRRTSSWVRKVIADSGGAFLRGSIGPTVELFCRILPREPATTTGVSCSWTAVVVYRTVGLAPRGLGRHRLGVGPKARIPRAERGLPFAVQHARAHLQQEMHTPLTPPHLLLLDHPLTDHLVHCGFDKACADALTVAIALAIVRNEVGVILNVRVELLHGFQQLSGCGILTDSDRDFEIALDGLHDLEGLVHIPMPQEPFEPFEFLADGRTDRVGHLLVAGRL